ncbi:GMC family oxidoreductase [Nitratireductor sp. XY-223]|uniref:GMC oxidoreductase n=1 Tax=Nitratireductor sp. XY-223 TaxID=2561926 RepID=UPI00145BB64B|nr:GMC family oxidoreductase [Nitratireductor sp. XY-223]
MSEKENFDAIVIGTGAGGACAAYQLVNAGMRVLAIEKGPWLKLDDFLEGGAYGMPGGFSSWGRGDELKYSRQRLLQQNVPKELRWLSYHEYGQSAPDPRPTKRGWMSQLVGGGTVHYGGASFRMEPVDFEMQSRFATQAKDLEQTNYADLGAEHSADLHDWPVSFAEFEPWFSEAERLVGIAAGPGSGLKPLRLSAAEKHIKTALEVANSEIELKPTPMAINSGKHMGREACHHSGLCQDYACRFEAKSDMRVTLLREAEKTGRLTIQPLSFVRKIHIKGSVAESLEVVVGDPEGGQAEIEKLTAPIIIVACEALESCRLLAASGIGNPDVLGRYVMFHVTGGARSLAPIPTKAWQNAPHTGFIDHFYNDHSNDSTPFIKTGIFLVSALGGPLQAVWRNWGADAIQYLNEIYPYKMDLSYIGEGLPTAHNRIELNTGTADRYGMPGTIVHYRPHPFDINAGVYAGEKATEILKIAGGTTHDEAPPELKKFLSKDVTARRMFHGSGGCRFGNDPKTSVLDRDCRVHGLDNLFVTDGSFMPTGSGVNPTLTIQANALRVGQRITEMMQ